jgi:hypothetical protein
VPEIVHATPKVLALTEEMQVSDFFTGLLVARAHLGMFLYRSTVRFADADTREIDGLA